MTLIEQARKLRPLIEKAIAQTLTDEEAVEAVTLFSMWYSDRSYEVGDRVKYEGKLYKCLTAHAAQETWTPSSSPSLWAEILPGQGGTAIGEWKQPDSTNPYMKGDKVTYQGKTWVSTADNNVWAPGVYGWEVVSEGTDSSESGGSTVDSSPKTEESTPEPEPEAPSVPEWVQPGAANPYKVGDQVFFNGHIYESTINGNVWSPSAYPGGWKQIS